MEVKNVISLTAPSKIITSGLKVELGHSNTEVKVSTTENDGMYLAPEKRIVIW